MAASLFCCWPNVPMGRVIARALTLAALAAAPAAQAQAQAQAQPPDAAASAGARCPALWQRSFPRLQDEQPQSLCQYAGQVVLVVNTASYCGFTPQYKGLEAIYRRYKARGFVVLGFPANDFGEQEPGANKAIAEFCENTFNVKFPMFAKSVVKVEPRRQQSAVRRAGARHRQQAALELPQIPDRPQRQTGRGLRLDDGAPTATR